MKTFNRTLQAFAFTIALLLATGAALAAGPSAEYEAYSGDGGRWVGAFTPAQNPIVDTLIDRRTGDQYFMDLWSFYSEGKIPGARSEIRIFLSTDGNQRTVYSGRTEGNVYVRINRDWVRSNTYLCVQTPWPIIAHQVLASGPSTACTRTSGEVHRWFRDGNGRTASDAWGVVAVMPAGI